MIKDFANFQNRIEMQGRKLQALYMLIQKKGEAIKSEDEKYNELKVLEISDGEYVGMKRTGHAVNFYPCVIQTIWVTKL